MGLSKKMIVLLVFLVLTFALAALAASNYVIYVGVPSGGDDTATLQAALDNCYFNHLAGCTIQLAAGTYKTKQLFIEEFNGIFKGMGMDQTVIQVLTPLEPPVRDAFLWGQYPSRTNKYAHLVIFASGNITVSDMTFKLNDPNPIPSGWCYGTTPDTCGQTYLVAMVGVMTAKDNSTANLVVERVGFDGVLDANGIPWYAIGPFIATPFADRLVTGSFKVVSCHINHANGGIAVDYLKNGQAIIGGSPSDANLIENSMEGTDVLDLDGSTFEFSYNNVSVAGAPIAGVAVFQSDLITVPPQNPPQYLIQHNTFNATGGYEDGVWILDIGSARGWGKTANFVVSDNVFNLNGSAAGPAYAAVESYFTVGTVTSNNRITGANTIFGISAESDSQCMLKANNLQNVAAEFAAISLDAGTTNCTVVGGDNKANVYNAGIGNIITGVNNMQGNPPGPAIKAAMQQKLNVLKSVRKP